MKKVLKLIWFYLKYPMYPVLWLLYYLFIGIPEMNKYMAGKHRGMQVDSIDHGLFTTTVKYNPNRKPMRGYLTIKEFHSMYFKSN